jgi:hypothetical protein
LSVLIVTQLMFHSDNERLRGGDAEGNHQTHYFQPR